MDELISRKQAIDAINKLRESTYAVDYGIVDCDDAINAIATLPPTEPKRGWWIEIINSRGVVVALRCSRCEKSPRHGVRSDFCPNCGADMREVTT